MNEGQKKLAIWDKINPMQIKPVAFIQVGRDEYDGELLYTMQFYLFGELTETKEPGQKAKDYINVCGITFDEFNFLVG
jgi:hypothetical protein